MNPRRRLRISILLLLMLSFAMIFGVAEASVDTGGGVSGGGGDGSKSKVPKKRVPRSRASHTRPAPGALDFQTKMVLVSFSIFMLIFVVVLLVIGHFTWFADIRHKLEQEWEEELKREEENQIASSILNEMTNPFAIDLDNSGGTTVRRKSSIDSNGCTRGLCVPPHHSILCPNNPNVPSLSDPLPFGIPDEEYDRFNDPVDYRSVRSRDWMNLESSVKVISEPIPMREQRFLSTGGNFSTGTLVPKPPVTPSTPGPFGDSDDNENEEVVGNGRNGNDMESGNNNFPVFPVRSIRKPSIQQFDISKLDLF